MILRYTVGSVEWTAKLTDAPIPNEQGEDSWGVCVYATHTILVSETASPDQRLKTLMHELYHATIADTGMPDHCEETQANYFGAIYTQMFLDTLRQLNAFYAFMNHNVEKPMQSKNIDF